MFKKVSTSFDIAKKREGIFKSKNRDIESSWLFTVMHLGNAFIDG